MLNSIQKTNVSFKANANPFETLDPALVSKSYSPAGASSAPAADTYSPAATSIYPDGQGANKSKTGKKTLITLILLACVAGFAHHKAGKVIAELGDSVQVGFFKKIKLGLKNLFKGAEATKTAITNELKPSGVADAAVDAAKKTAGDVAGAITDAAPPVEKAAGDVAAAGAQA